MKPIVINLALLTVVLSASTSQGADVVLRQRATLHGAIVRLGDIADISASSSSELRDLASTPLWPAPAPGTKQFLNAAQIRELLAARGVRLDRLTFTGANLVEIGDGQPPALKGESAADSLTFEAAEQRLHQAIEQHLREHNNSEGRWRVEVKLNRDDVPKVADLGANFTTRGKRRIQSGRQRFVLSSERGDHDLLVSADVTKIQPVVVAIKPIPRDQLVRAADVEIREREGVLPAGSIADLQQVVGKVARRSLRPGEIVQENHLRAPWQVRRGETINVFVRTGGIVVRTRAVARADGAMGDLIAVETIQDKQRLDASVSGPGEATVYATGGRAIDYASLDRNESRR